MNTSNESISNIVGKGYSLYLKMYPAALLLIIISILGNLYNIYLEMGGSATELYKSENLVITSTTIVFCIDMIITWIVSLGIYFLLVKGYYREKANPMAALGTGVCKLFPSIGIGIIYLVALIPAIILILLPLLIELVAATIWGQASIEVPSQLSVQQASVQQAVLSHESVYQNAPSIQFTSSQPTLSDIADQTQNSMVGVTKLVAAASYILGIIYVIYIALRFALCLPLLVNQNKGVFGSVADSFKLTKGRWWKTFIIIIIGVIPSIVVTIIGVIVGIIGVEGVSQEAISNISQTLVEFLFLPLIPAIMTVYLEVLQPLNATTHEVAQEDHVTDETEI